MDTCRNQQEMMGGGGSVLHLSRPLSRGGGGGSAGVHPLTKALWWSGNGLCCQQKTTFELSAEILCVLLLPVSPVPGFKAVWPGALTSLSGMLEWAALCNPFSGLCYVGPYG